jgi:DNA-binding HxlR family transcriptional regulator
VLADRGLVTVTIYSPVKGSVRMTDLGESLYPVVIPGEVAAHDAMMKEHGNG